MDLMAANVSYTIIAYALSGLCIIGVTSYVLWRDISLAKQLGRKSLRDDA